MSSRVGNKYIFAGISYFWTFTVYTVAPPPGVVPGVVPAGGVPAGPGVPGCGAPSGGVGFSN